MDKSALKKVIKPLIKECLKEVLMEEGLVKVIKEYTSPQQDSQVLKNVPEATDFAKTLKKESIQAKKVLQSNAKNVSKSVFGFDIFEGTNPAPPDGEISEGEGVNIDKLINQNLGSWTQHLGTSQRKKA